MTTIEEMDVEAFINMRAWLEQADIEFKLHGVPFSVSIRPEKRDIAPGRPRSR
jgi:hypothetical protein